MSNTSSPYVEVGMTGHDIMRDEYSRKVAPVLYHARRVVDVNRDGHRWEFDATFRGPALKREVCRFCHHPRFAVDGMKCRGKRDH